MTAVRNANKQYILQQEVFMHFEQITVLPMPPTISLPVLHVLHPVLPPCPLARHSHAME